MKDKSPTSLEDLDLRLRQARSQLKPPPGDKGPNGKQAPSGLGMAFRIGTELVGGIIVGVGIGLLLDAWLDTSPWFMVAFFAFAVAVNVFPKAAVLGDALKPIGSMSLSTALAAVGLSIDFESVTEKGVSPLLSAFLAWGILAVGVYLFLSVVMP